MTENNSGISAKSTFRMIFKSGPNLDLVCIWQSDAAPFCENYAKLLFDTKHLEKGLNTGW